MTDSRVTPGNPTPEIKLPSTDGGEQHLGGKGRWQVAVFYRGRHCPLCSKYLKTLDSLLEDFGDAGAEMIAISGEPRRLSPVAALPSDIQGARLSGLIAGYVARDGVAFPAAMEAPDVWGTTLEDVVASLIEPQ